MQKIKTFETFLNEGLESKVDQVIDAEAPDLKSAYVWDNGMCVEDENDARELIRVLNVSKQFGPASYDKKEKKIKFGRYQG